MGEESTVSRYLTTANNELEAQIILARLREAGLSAWESNSLGGRAGSGGPRDVYVEDADLERARAVLREVQDVDEAELDALAEGAGESGPHDGEAAT
jgi:hypothetical protein